MSVRMPPASARPEEPVGAQVAIEPVRAEADRLHHPPDRARLHQLRRAGHRPHLEALREIDRPDAPGLPLQVHDVGELGRGDHGRLVDHDVLAVTHRLERDLGPLRGDRGGHDQLDLGILEQRAHVAHAREIGKAPHEAVERHRRVARVVALALGAELQEPADLMVDVAVIEADRGELERGMVGHAGLRAQTVSIATARRSADDRSTASIRWCTRSASRPVTRGLRS